MGWSLRPRAARGKIATGPDRTAGTRAESLQRSRQGDTMQLIMFTKHLQEFSVAETARRVKALGFDGLDLTVRPGGHVVPERVGTDLPRAVADAQGEGLTIPL